MHDLAPASFLALGDIIRRNARCHPTDTAYVFGGQSISFAEHHSTALRLATALRDLGLRHQSRIAVMCMNSYQQIVAFSACELAGFVAATVNYRLAAPEVSQILADCTPSILIFDEAYAELIASIREGMPSIRHFICIGNAPSWALSFDAVIDGVPAGQPAPWRIVPEDLIHIIYTSGTTGRPKGVMRSHFAEIQMAEMMTTEVGLLPDDVVQITMPLFHVGARWVQLGAQLRAAKVIVHPRYDEEEVITTIEREKVTLAHMAPTLVQRTLLNPLIETTDLSSLRTIYYSAAPMPLPTLKRGLEMLGNVFVQLYGMTEGGGTTLGKLQHRPDGTERERRWLSSVGQAPNGVQIRIVDADGRDMPKGQPGEVVTRTATRMSGYWNNSAATVDAVREGWYYTGDIGYLDEEDFLYLVDRKKDMIISGGENIYCREVEEALASHPSVAEVAVFGLPDPTWGEIVVAAIVPAADAEVGADALEAHCRQQIASYKKPKKYVFPAEIPKLNTGKVNKIALRQTYSAR
ncbi:class I adenylate-forming enzyme family protein [Pseudochelatococcus sp. B33]